LHILTTTSKPPHSYKLVYAPVVAIKVYCSVSSISEKTLGKACKSIFKKDVSKNWDDNLSQLSVQSRFLDACDLEKGLGKNP